MPVSSSSSSSSLRFSTFDLVIYFPSKMISLLFVLSCITTYIVIQYSMKLIFQKHRFSGSNLVFDPEILQEIATKGTGKNKEEMFDIVHNELLKRYPKHIWKERKWLWFNAGGWMASICFLHASLTEYVILFGSPTPTSGHSGRYPLEVFDFVMDGEYFHQLELTTDAVCTRAGEASYLGPMESCTFCIKDHAWMLEYGRGMLPFSLPFQMTGTFFSSLDFISMLRLQSQYAFYLFYELLINRKL